MSPFRDLLCRRIKIFKLIYKAKVKRFRKNLKDGDKCMYYDTVLVECEIDSKDNDFYVFKSNDNLYFGELKHFYPLWCNNLFIKI